MVPRRMPCGAHSRRRSTPWGRAVVARPPASQPRLCARGPAQRRAAPTLCSAVAHLDHFQVGNPEFLVAEQGNQDSVLRVGVQTRARVAHKEGVHKQRRAFGELQQLLLRWGFQQLPVGVRHEEIFRLDALLLHPTGRNVNLAPTAPSTGRYAFRRPSATDAATTGSHRSPALQKERILVTYSCLMEMPPPVPVTQPLR